jgi:iron complex transport system substrate-binding protein
MILRLLLCATWLFVVALPVHAKAGEMPEDKPQRIVSLNLCTDELVLRLAEPGRIASVTWLSQDPRSSTVAGLAARVPANHGRAEEVLRFDPDLVLAGTFTTRVTVAFLKQVGIPVLELGVPQTLDGVRVQIREVAHALGETARGERMIAGMEARFAAARRREAGDRPSDIRAVVLRPNGFTVGPGTLVDEMISLAGLRNLAAELHIESYGQIPLETAIMAGADMLIVDAERDTLPSLATELLRHPALAKLSRRISTAALPSRLWTCAGPQLADAVSDLIEARWKIESR